MKPINFISGTRDTRPIHNPIPSERAFTFVELLVVIGILALLALMILPAMADVKNKGGRTQCAANLRQLARAAMIYANDYNNRLPPVQVGANPVNVIRNHFYTRFMWSGLGSYQIPKIYSQVQGSFSNAGYLWGGNYLGDGTVAYCPSQWGTGIGEDGYSPLLRSDTGGSARSSYQFNPRAAPTDPSAIRLYQKTDQLPPHKLFGVDTLDISPSLFAHLRERGWNILFTDGSVKFSQNETAYNLIKAANGTIFPSTGEQIYDQLEQDH